MTNVTRFPGPRKSGPASGQGGGLDWRKPKTPVLVGYGASLLAVVLVVVSGWGLIGTVFAVIAAVIAATKRQEGPPWASSHHEFNLRGVIIAAAVWILSASLGFIPLLGGVLIWVGLAAGLWLFVRTAFGLVKAIDTKPVPRPMSFLV